MIAYVDPGSLKVGDEVALELYKSGVSRAEGLLTVVQVSKVTRVEPSRSHGGTLDEVEF